MDAPLIRPAGPADRAAIWRIMQPVIRAGETYALPRDMAEAAALEYWFSPAHECFAAEWDGDVVGIYFLQANGIGGAGHVANCGYMTDLAASGRGVARAMCLHSLARAAERGFRAVQFNFVVSSNVRAVGLWQAMGFDVVGRLPGAFAHPVLGFVEALVMFRAL